MKFEIKHRTSAAILFSLKCESLNVCLVAAVEAKTDLGGANLEGADLEGAYLRGADLEGAYLGGADLRGVNYATHLGQPNSWFAWTYVGKEGNQRVVVGCHDYSLAEGHTYWAGKDDRREILAALDYAEAIGKLRGRRQ